MEPSDVSALVDVFVLDLSGLTDVDVPVSDLCVIPTVCARGRDGRLFHVTDPNTSLSRDFAVGSRADVNLSDGRRSKRPQKDNKIIRASKDKRT